MKNSNLVLVIALFVVVSLFSSCANKGCKGGGGWYGDRNLSSVTPEAQQLPEITDDQNTREICAD